MKHYFIVKFIKDDIDEIVYDMWSDEETAKEFLHCFQKQLQCGLILLEVKNV